MTQEEKQKLLVALCGIIPHGFIVHRYSDNCDISINSVDDFAHFLEYSEGEEFKPYLRPMSSMTEEEADEFEKISNELLENGENTEIWDTVVDWLNAHHFDHRHLIEKGLALEAKEGMYKIY